MPYTDVFIFPDGRMGLCCCDNLESTTMADLKVTPLKEAWNSETYRMVRQAIRNGRSEYPFCKYCDFIDAGLRMDAVEDILKNSGTMRGARQSMFSK